MPSQSQVETTLLNASYKLAQLANANLTLINRGALAIKEQFINYFSLNLVGLQYQYNAQDYTSSTTVTLYQRLNGFVGIPANATIDPNFQAPNTTIIIEGGGGTEPITLNKTQADLIDAGGGNWYLPFLDNSGDPLPFGVVPVSVTINGESFTFTYSNNFIPPRIYGFSNNDTQTIVVTAI